jgi:hypothetical protein
MSIAEEQVRELPPGPASTGAHDLPPTETRAALIGALAMLRAKHRPLPSRKHGNQPR